MLVFGLPDSQELCAWRRTVPEGAMKETFKELIRGEGSLLGKVMVDRALSVIFTTESMEPSENGLDWERGGLWFAVMLVDDYVQSEVVPNKVAPTHPEFDRVLEGVTRQAKRPSQFGGLDTPVEVDKKSTSDTDWD
jgi:hypothetical protein